MIKIALRDICSIVGMHIGHCMHKENLCSMQRMFRMLQPQATIDEWSGFAAGPPLENRLKTAAAVVALAAVSVAAAHVPVEQASTSQQSSACAPWH